MTESEKHAFIRMTLVRHVKRKKTTGNRKERDLPPDPAASDQDKRYTETDGTVPGSTPLTNLHDVTTAVIDLWDDREKHAKSFAEVHERLDKAFSEIEARPTKVVVQREVQPGPLVIEKHIVAQPVTVEPPPHLHPRVVYVAAAIAATYCGLATSVTVVAAATSMACVAKLLGYW